MHIYNDYFFIFIYNMFTRIFYSEKCSGCLNLWNIIYSEGITRMFIPICVDNFSAKELSQLKLLMVPAIVISGANQSPVIYEGLNQCSQWLSTFIYNRRLNIKQRVEQQRRLIQKQQILSRIKDEGATEYVDTEMEGISDSYSYNNTDLYQPKNFVNIGDEINCRIITPNFEQNKIHEEEMLRQLRDLETNRKSDNQKFMQLMEQNQIKAVFNNVNN